MLIAQQAQQAQIIEAQRGGDADPHRAADIALDRAQFLFGHFQRIDQSAGMDQQLVGFRRRDQPARGAMKQHGAKMGFHLIEPSRYGGVARMHLGSDARETGLFT